MWKSAFAPGSGAAPEPMTTNYANIPAAFARVAIVAAVFLAVLAPGPAHAHPHIFMESRISFVFDDKGLAELRAELIFEKFFSQRARAQLDMNGDGKIDEQELTMGEPLLAIDELTLTSFVFLWADGKRWVPEKPLQRRIILTEKQFGVVLTVPCRIAVEGKPRTVALVFYDKACFVRILPAKDRSVRIVGAGALDVTVRPPVKTDRIKREPGAPMNPAYMMPDPSEIVLTFQPKQKPERPPAAATTPPAKTTTTPAKAAAPTVISFGEQQPETFMEHIFYWQGKAKDALADLNTEYDRTGSVRAVLLMLLVALGYGILHAAGPGHGKAVAASYLLLHKRALRSGLLLGVLIPLIHTASGVVVSVSVHFLVERMHSGRATADVRNTGELVSYALIAVLGAALLVANIRAWLTRARGNETGLTARFKSPLTLALAVGIFPCPTTIIIMELFINDAPLLGLLLVLFQALGMATTICTVCLLVACGRLSLTKAAGRHTRRAELLVRVLATAGALLVMLLGLMFFYGGIARYHPAWLKTVGLWGC